MRDCPSHERAIALDLDSGTQTRLADLRHRLELDDPSTWVDEGQAGWHSSTPPPNRLTKYEFVITITSDDPQEVQETLSELRGRGFTLTPFS